MSKFEWVVASGLFLILGTSSQPPKPDPPKKIEPVKAVTLQVEAGADGRINDLRMEGVPETAAETKEIQQSGSNPRNFPRTVADLLAVKKNPPLPPLHEQVLRKILPEELEALRKKPVIDEKECRITVVSDANLRFADLAAVLDACRQAGFSPVELSAPQGRQAYLRLLRDGTAILNGRVVNAAQIKEGLNSLARIAGGSDKLEVIVQTIPEARYDAVSALIQLVKEAKVTHLRLQAVTEPVAPPP
jgi:biopolymer transport protein ExbD